MGTVTQTIGTSSRNFSTIALWEAALPASLVTDGNSYIGQCFNDAEFNISTTQLVLAGSTTDATHTITLTTGSGQGFRDNGSAASNALRYNQSNGVGVTGAVGYDYNILVTDNFVTISNLQLKTTATNGHGAVKFTGTNATIDSCIIQGFSGASTTTGMLQFEGTGTTSTATNCLVITDTSTAKVGLNSINGATFFNNTIVKPSDKTAGATGILCHYSSVTITNCVVAGYTTAIAAGGSTLTGTNNAVDAGSYPTGLTGQVSLTIATEFVQPSNASSVMDWRLNSTSVKCKDNGTNSGAPSTDIVGQAISNTTKDAGAWELQQGGGGGTFIAAWAVNTNRPVIGTGTYAG